VVFLHWIEQFFHPGELRTPHGGYWFWSGIGSGSPLFIMALGWWYKHNCHVHRCPRLSWHPHPEHGHPVCKRHHPHDPATL
jgi:hypothetical protein